MRYSYLKKMKIFNFLTVLLVILSLLYSMTAGLGAYLQPCYANTASVAGMATKAVDFINTKYHSGEAVDGYTAYVLDLSGEDLEAVKWTTGNKTLKKRIENLADLLGNNNSLITYIMSTQNADGSFGPYANEYGTKAPLQALSAIKDETTDAAVYNKVNSSIALAISYYKNGYQSGNMTYDATGWNFDYRCVEALAAAGEDLSSGGWANGGSSLKDAAVASANAAAANPAALNAVSLSKELTVLHAVYPTSAHINILADAIIAQKDTSVPGQVYFGGSIYDDTLILTVLGKAGRLGDIDQNKAVAYLNTFKTIHNNSWGTPAGAAWGGFTPEESDLTAQVISALSYFDDANNHGSNVYNTIQDGLSYLSDIQDPDTAAVTAQWDSTFATAETLIALKSLGKTYDEYAGASSSWLKKSKTKTVAQCLLALSRWNDDTARRDRLASLLAGRQKAAGLGQGSFENSVYSDMWAFIAMGEAGHTSSIDTTTAKDYILSKQGADGSWGEIFGGVYYADFLSTTQAIRALTYLPDKSDQQIQSAIDKGLVYLKGLQQTNGGVYSTWDDPAVDNSELIVTLHKLGLDPSTGEWKNTDELTPVDCLLNNTMNADGSFGTAKNVFGAAEALSALLLVTGQGGSGGSSQNPANQDECSVNIAVVGMNGELLYNPQIVTVSKDGRWGKTVLGALHATGLNYYADQNTGFVTSIKGQANSGKNGWMFKVNGVVAAVPGKDTPVSTGDQIIWWYSNDINSSGPDWNSLLSGSIVTATTGAITAENLTPALQTTKKALAALENLDQLLKMNTSATELGLPGEAATAVVVVEGEKLPSRSEFLATLKELAGNPVDLAQKVEAATGAVISDKLGEIGLVIPVSALSQNLTITVKEAGINSSKDGTGGNGIPPAGYKRVAPVYSFGPDGANFAVPVTLALKVAIPPLVRPENLVLACYDKGKEKWVAVPAVVDVGKGVILAKLSHFSDYTVLDRQERKSFDDINPTSCEWAVEPVELLAGAGVLAGVDGKRYEPDRSITRAELAKILVNALNLPAAKDKPTFKDVTETEWFSGCIAAATQAGLVKGYEDGTFRPDRMVTREEIATVLSRSFDLNTMTDAKLPFKDAGAVSAWAADSLAAVASEGLIKGYPDGTLQPQGTVTRAECAVMIYRALANY